jgi:hypothetical protein
MNARFEHFLVIGSIHKLPEGAHESESEEKVEQTHYALQRSLTKSISSNVKGTECTIYNGTQSSVQIAVSVCI